MTRTAFHTAAAIVVPWLVCATALVDTEARANTNEKFATVGPFEIIRIYEGQDFTRCAASLGQGSGMLRIAYNAERKYTVSVPGVKKSSDLMMYIEGPEDVDDISFKAQSDGNRTWGNLDKKQVKDFVRTKKQIRVFVNQDNSPDQKTFTWPIGNTSLAEVVSKVEQCMK